jgi:hypothetical protein
MNETRMHRVKVKDQEKNKKMQRLEVLPTVLSGQHTFNTTTLRPPSISSTRRMHPL